MKMTKAETQGSQYFLRKAVNQQPALLRDALRESGALQMREDVSWHSPLLDKSYQEYRDGAAVKALGLENRIVAPLADFWPARGPVWDALGTSSQGRPILVEAKAHIPEGVSREKAIAVTSKKLIGTSLALARGYYTRKSESDWRAPFYQYANRLAHQFWLREQNGISSNLVFLYFTNAVAMNGPSIKHEWQGAIRLIHAVLGLPDDLAVFGVYHAFLDASELAG
jgi:hypothetical protein